MNETMNGEIMTLAEIEERFDHEWILVEAPVFDANDKLLFVLLFQVRLDNVLFDWHWIQGRPVRSAAKRF